MHVALVSYHYDRDIGRPEELLQRYDTTVGWAEGLCDAGARVSVVFRFSSDAKIERPEAQYHFVRDPTIRMGSLADRADRVNRLVASLQPDVVQVDGLSFARQAARLRAELPRTTILLQDHANRPPRQSINRATLAQAMRHIEGIVLCAKDLAEPWHRAKILPSSTPLFEIPEGSSRFCPGDRNDARGATGLSGDPLLLWVGRLDANKDPLTILNAFGRVAKALPRAMLAMVFHEGELKAQVCEWKDTHQVGNRVSLLGRVNHADLEMIYRSCDLFVLGSHREGSGYALIEALSCGITPVVTSIPTFRELAGDECGFYFLPGDESGCADAILRAATKGRELSKDRVRQHFEQELSFSAIGRRALAAYRDLLDQSSERCR